MGTTSTTTYDNLRRPTLTQAPAPFNYQVKYSYDANGNLEKKEVENKDKDGNLSGSHPWITTTWTYSTTNQRLTMTEDIDENTTRTTSTSYDLAGRVFEVTKPEGNKVGYAYDVRGLLTTVTRGVGSGQEASISFEYDLNGNRTKVVDGRMNPTSTAYDLFDRQVRVTDALGNYTELTLDAGGNLTKIQRKDAAGSELQRSSRYYDERGRHWKTSDLRKDPATTYADAVTIYERLGTGQVSKVTDARGNDTLTTHDAAGRVTEYEDAMGNIATYSLDANGLATTTTLSEVDGATTVTHEYRATYDALGRKLTDVEVDRNNSSNLLTTAHAYDSRGNRVFVVDAAGSPTRWTFDALSRATRRERALSLGVTIDDFVQARETTWAYDKNDRLTDHFDDSPNRTSWQYDALDRRVVMTHPDQTIVTWSYDAADNATTITDAAGNVISDTFDSLNRNTARSIALVSGFGGTTAETRSYDALGRMTIASDDDYKVTLQYADLGLRSSVYSERQEYVGATPHPKTVFKTYDAVGAKATEVYPSGLSLSYGYNAIGAMTSVSDGTVSIASFGYVGAREKSVLFGNGATQTNSYGGFGERVTSVHHEDNGGNTLVRLDYGYSAVHDRTFERYGGTGSSGDAFQYDMMRRLSKAWIGSVNPSSPSGSSYAKTIDFNMDDDGNRTARVVTPNAGASATTNYTRNNLNQYVAVGAATYAYDANGNVTDDGTQAYVYNYRNQLIEVKASGGGASIATYRYDGIGRRVEKHVSGAGAERHILSGLEVIEVFDGIASWKQRFVYGQIVDQVVMLEQPDVLDGDADGNTAELARNYYHRNALGSVMFVSQQDGTEAATYRYDPYGKCSITRGGSVQATDPLGQDVGYTGRWWDAESELWFYRLRHQSPELGRFMQRDPLGVGPDANVYAYVDSRPTGATDPLGLFSISFGGVTLGPNRGRTGVITGNTGCPNCDFRIRKPIGFPVPRGKAKIWCKRRCKLCLKKSVLDCIADALKTCCQQEKDLERDEQGARSAAATSNNMGQLGLSGLAIAGTLLTGPIGAITIVGGRFLWGGRVASGAKTSRANSRRRERREKQAICERAVRAMIDCLHHAGGGNPFEVRCPPKKCHPMPKVDGGQRR